MSDDVLDALRRLYVVAIGNRDITGEAADEISRLRARVEELERELEAYRAAAPVHLQTMKDMQARIEELEDDAPGVLVEDIKRLRTRINELGRERDQLKERILDLKAEIREWRTATQCG